MRILVTGGTGFIGRALVEGLMARGHSVATLSRRAEGLPSVKHHSLDVRSDEAIAVASDADGVVHLAGLSNASLSHRDPLLFNRVNALGTLAVLEGARRGGGRVVFASSQRIYRPSLQPIPEDGWIEPQDPYGYSKLCGESWVEMYSRFYQVSATVVRFFSVYGPGLVVSEGTSGVVGIFVGAALRGERLIVHRNQKRDLTYVSDVVQGIILAIEKRPAAPYDCYNIATGVGTTMEELAEQVRRVTGSRSAVVVEQQDGFGHLVADISRARAELDYSPRIDLEQGLGRYVAWYRANG